MPPRARKTASPARSRSASRSNSRRTSMSKPAVPEESPSRHDNTSPQPDPVAVQRLIDEAMARAAARRTSTPGRRPSQVAYPHAKTSGGCIVTRVWNAVFPAQECLYSARTTAVLTDLIGAFLVTCLAIYFTTAGYLFYRDVALSS